MVTVPRFFQTAGSTASHWTATGRASPFAYSGMTVAGRDGAVPMGVASSTGLVPSSLRSARSVNPQAWCGFAVAVAVVPVEDPRDTPVPAAVWLPETCRAMAAPALTSDHCLLFSVVTIHCAAGSDLACSRDMVARDALPVWLAVSTPPVPVSTRPSLLVTTQRRSFANPSSLFTALN